MKAKNAILAVLTVVFLMGCASTGQNADIKIAKDVNLYLYDSKMHSFLAVQPDITILDIYGFQNERGNKLQLPEWGANLVIPSGQCTVIARYITGNYISDIFSTSYTFESGKSYKLNYNIIKEVSFGQKGEIQFFIEETSQNDALQNYLAFSEANPRYLEGVWRYSRKYPYENLEIAFDGGSFTTTAFNRVSKHTSIMEGIYFYNENTIILYCEKHQGHDILQREILSYELTNGILRIKSGGNTAVVTIGGLKGDYKKK